MSGALHTLLLWPQASGRHFRPTAFRGGRVLTAYLMKPQRNEPAPAKTMSPNVGQSGSAAVSSGPAAAAPRERVGPSAHEATPIPATTADLPPVIPRSAPHADAVQPEPQYWSRSQLTRGPQPRSPVVLTLPASWRTPGRYRARFALYVDEEGVVQRVERLNNPDFPAPLESEVRTAFMGVLFEPGEVKGMPVRARMMVEVDFDATVQGRSR